MLGIPKTIVFNFRYLPFFEALRFPFLLSYHVRIKKLGGEVKIACPPAQRKMGMIKIGFSDVGIFDRRTSPTIWQLSGLIRFRGKANIGHGSKLSVSGELDLGNGFGINAESAIICRKRICFGEGCLLSWDVLVMDTDFHKLMDGEGTIMNEDEPVWIGPQVWIGCRSTIIKGAHLPKGTVIGAGSLVSGRFTEEQCVIAGSPAKVLKNGVTWE